MKKLLTKSALAAAALACLGSAHATLITFDEPILSPFAAPPLFAHGDEFYQGGFWIDPFSNAAGAQVGDLVGALVDGSDVANTCWSVTCPTNNATNFYTGLNDGALVMGHTTAPNFKVSGFDASFVGAGGLSLPPVAGLLRLQGAKADGTGFLTQTFQLAGPDANGALNFAHYNTSGAFASTLFSYMYIFGFACNAQGSCSAFSSDLGQFALDNIDVTQVPEPTSIALAALGLGLAAVAGKRRRKA